MRKLEVIPLGGLGEVEKNMMVMRHGHNILFINAGIMFPENNMPSVDYIIPDYQYLRGRQELQSRVQAWSKTSRWNVIYGI